MSYYWRKEMSDAMDRAIDKPFPVFPHFRIGKQPSVIQSFGHSIPKMVTLAPAPKQSRYGGFGLSPSCQ
jgi:hypothetical protein